VRRFGLIGCPLIHSFSQKFFTEKFKREGIVDCVYEKFSIPVIDELPALLKARSDLHGLNVTIPYKEKVIAYLDNVSEVVRQTGACNCIRIKEGRLSGFNTDTIGFEISLKTKLLPHHKKALILGKGGAAKAVAYTLSKLGIEFLYVVRRESHDIDTILYNQVNEQIMRSHQLIINTTPIGTFPDVDAAPQILYQYITADHYLYDLVYNPPETLFLKLAGEQGAIIQNGLEMLVIQAEESWKIWNQ
jgi:shikimate dehydrogenase